MTDPLSLSIGGALVLAGFLIGRANLRSRKPRPVKPTCACEHSFGAHTDDGCQADVARDRYNQVGSHTGYTWVPCACHKYTGPLPLKSSGHRPS